MICILYESCLLLALPDRSSSKYKVVVGTSLASTSIEESDNGKGMLSTTYIERITDLFRPPMPHRTIYLEDRFWKCWQDV
jgi:hypothetical protein